MPSYLPEFLYGSEQYKDGVPPTGLNPLVAELLDLGRRYNQTYTGNFPGYAGFRQQPITDMRNNDKTAFDALYEKVQELSRKGELDYMPTGKVDPVDLYYAGKASKTPYTMPEYTKLAIEAGIRNLPPVQRGDMLTNWRSPGGNLREPMFTPEMLAYEQSRPKSILDKQTPAKFIPQMQDIRLPTEDVLSVSTQRPSGEPPPLDPKNFPGLEEFLSPGSEEGQ
jgi:hypothetical protein